MKEVNYRRHKLTPWLKIIDEPFCPGPLPLFWFKQGAEAGANGLVMLALWREANLTGNGYVRMANKRWESLGVSRKTAHRSLKALEAAEMVELTSRQGCAPIVKINMPPAFSPVYMPLEDRETRWTFKTTAETAPEPNAEPESDLPF